MNAAEWTSVVGVIIAVVGSIFVPVFIYRRTNTKGEEHRDATAEAIEDRTAANTWRDINQAINDDRNNLQRQLNEQKRDHEETIRELRKEYDEKLAERDSRINSMQRELDRLYRELYSRDHPGTP